MKLNRINSNFFSIFLFSLLLILSSCSKPKFYQQTMVNFSKNPGLYQTGTQLTLQLSTDNDSAVIYYTIDGSKPNIQSPKYSHPLLINEDITIRTKSYYGNNSSIENKGTFSFVDTFQVYVIGDIGPSGGTIFYNKGNYSDGWRYLEASTRNKEGSNIPWESSQNVNFVIGDTSEDIGEGLSNTLTILDNFSSKDGPYAALYCWNLETVKDNIIYDDWFLPSLNELKEIWTVLNNQYTNYDETVFWSSSNYNLKSAWSINFIKDELLSLLSRLNSTNKFDVNKVRAIRML